MSDSIYDLLDAGLAPSTRPSDERAPTPRMEPNAHTRATQFAQRPVPAGVEAIPSIKLPAVVRTKRNLPQDVDGFLTATGLDWTVVKEPMQRKCNGRDVEGFTEIVREDTGQTLSVSREGWEPVQNRDVVELAHTFVESHGATLSLGGGIPRRGIRARDGTVGFYGRGGNPR